MDPDTGDVYRPTCPIKATAFAQLHEIRGVLKREDMFDCYRELIERAGDDVSDLSVIWEIAASYVTLVGE